MLEVYHQRVVSHAKLRPGATAILSRDGQKITYGELAERFRKVHRGLLRLGVRPADRIAGLMPGGPRMAETVLGVSATCIYAPLNPEAPIDELKRAIHDLQPKWVLTGGKDANVGVPCISLDDLMSAADDAPFQSPAEDRVALLLSTSGTTASAKRVQVTLSMYSYGAGTIERHFALTEHDRHFTTVPQFHSLGLVSGVMTPLITGGSVVLCPGFDRDRFEEDWERTSPTWLSATPTILRALADLAPHLRGKLRRPRFVRSAAAPLPQAVLATVEQMLGAPILQTYGMTEAICATMETPTHSRRGSVGRVTAGELRIVTGSGETAETNERGLVLLRGPNVTPGYDRNDEANEESFADGWLVTGDEGYLDEEGYLFLTGRVKEFINRGGQKVNPSEVDEILLRHPGVRRAATFAMPDSRLGEEVAAAVTPLPGATVTESALQEFAAERLANYKVPRRILIVDEIPLSATGKFQRRKLSNHYAGRLARPVAQSLAEPSGRVPSVLLAIFRNVAQSDSVTCSDNFFDHCDSLQTALFLHSVEEKLGVPPIPPPVLWRAPNVESLAAYLEGNALAPESPEFYCIEPHGDLPAVIFIPPDLHYAHLWRELKGNVPMFGLRLPGHLWTEFGPSIPAIAEWCADQIQRSFGHRQFSASRQFCLAGWCLSGVIAYETARLLHRRGIGPTPIMIFNGHDILPEPGHGWSRKARLLWRNAERTAFHIGRLIKGDVDRMDYLHKRFQGLRERLQRWRQENSDTPVSHPEEIAIRALHRYQPAPYGGDVLHIMAKDRPRGLLRDPSRVWGPFVQGRHRWHEVNGDHHSMFDLSGSQQAAVIVEQALQTMQQEKSVMGAHS